MTPLGEKGVQHRKHRFEWLNNLTPPFCRGDTYNLLSREHPVNTSLHCAQDSEVIAQGTDLKLPIQVNLKTVFQVLLTTG